MNSSQASRHDPKHGPVHLFDHRTDGDCNVKTLCGLPTIAVGWVVDDPMQATCSGCRPVAQTGPTRGS